MALIVNTNIASLNAQRNLSRSNSRLAKSIERLSSGLRINSAADDAAGLSIATKFAAQVRGISQAIRNGSNAISLVQVAEGAINTTTNILQRLRELAVQAASDDNTTNDRAILGKEVTNLVAELTRISTTAEFNGQKLLDGTFTNKIFQVGANTGQTISLSIETLTGIGKASKTALGTADLTTDIEDGVLTAIDAGFAENEFTIDGVAVAATKETDDQFSVLEIQSGQVQTATSALSGFTININGVDVRVTELSGLDSAAGLTGAEVAGHIVDAINEAGIENITARLVGTDQFAITAKDGTNLFLAADNDGTDQSLANINTELGLTDVSAAFGSGATGQAVESFNGESSAIAKAVAINSITATTGVTATVQNTTATANADFGADFSLESGDLFINGVGIGESTDTLTSLIAAINLKTSATGVTASKDPDDAKLVLTASDGRNITLTFKDDGIGDNIGFDVDGDKVNDSIVIRGKIDLSSAVTFDLKGTLGDLDDSFIADKTVTKTDDVVTELGDITAIKVSTQLEASDALRNIDQALDDVNNLRADLGAIQNRIEFTIGNLRIAGENMAAAESRIRDVDFASEVAIFTKNQILVQAGAAMLAQANTLPQIALQLLQ